VHTVSVTSLHIVTNPCFCGAASAAVHTLGLVRTEPDIRHHAGVDRNLGAAGAVQLRGPGYSGRRCGPLVYDGTTRTRFVCCVS
jgi:hypothetical protein